MPISSGVVADFIVLKLCYAVCQYRFHSRSRGPALATYRKKQLSQQYGRYRRVIGKDLNARGELKLRRFLLGTDEPAAEFPSRRLEKLRFEIEADFKRRRGHALITQHIDSRVIETEPITGELIKTPISILKTGPIWEPHTLAMAEVIRNGGNEIHVLPASPRPNPIINPESLDYVARIMDLPPLFAGG